MSCVKKMVLWKPALVIVIGNKESGPRSIGREMVGFQQEIRFVKKLYTHNTPVCIQVGMMRVSDELFDDQNVGQIKYPNVQYNN